MDDVGAQQPCYPEAWCRGETVGGGQRPSPAPDTRDLISLADESGGHHVTLTNRTDLAALFARIADELRSQYVLGVTPLVLDGKVHTLQVQVRHSVRIHRPIAQDVSREPELMTTRAVPWIGVATLVTALLQLKVSAGKQAPELTFVDVRVETPDGVFVSDLDQKDFQVYTDGRPRAIAQFSVNQGPISVLLVVDLSLSASERFFDPSRLGPSDPRLDAWYDPRPLGACCTRSSLKPSDLPIEFGLAASACASRSPSDSRVIGTSSAPRPIMSCKCRSQSGWGRHRSGTCWRRRSRSRRRNRGNEQLCFSPTVSPQAIVGPLGMWPPRPPSGMYRCTSCRWRSARNCHKVPRPLSSFSRIFRCAKSRR